MLPNYRKRIRIYLLVLAALAGIFLLVNAPQCPEHFTQEQVDASRCIVGANIGLGLYVLFAAPVLVVVLGLLGFAMRKQYGRTAAGEGGDGFDSATTEGTASEIDGPSGRTQ